MLSSRRCCFGPLAALVVGCSGPAPSAKAVPAVRVTSAAAVASASPPAGDLGLPGPPADAKVRQISLAEAGLDPDAFDPSANVCEDLYRYACGNWVKSFRMPADKVTFEKTYSAGTDQTQTRLREILEAIPSSATDASAVALRDFYGSCMDEARIDARGTGPIDGYLAKIKAARTRVELAGVVGEIHPIIDAFFSFGTRADSVDSQVLAARLGEGGIKGLVSADSYLSVEPDKVALRAAYVKEALAMMSFAKVPDKEAHAVIEDAMKIQTALAAAMTRRPDERDKDLSARLDLEELEKQAPGFPYRDFFSKIGLTHTKNISIANLEFTKKMAELYRTSSLAELRHYVYWRTLGDLSYVLGTPFQKERHELWSKIWGAYQAEPRWKQCVAATRTTLRDLMAREYVARYFPEETRDGFRAMFTGFIASFDDRLGELDWMDGATRANARKKLSKMTLKMAMPENVEPYALPIGVDTYAENVLTPILTFAKRGFGKVGGPVNRKSWSRSPLDTNAFVDNTENAAIFPAAFLQPPIYDAHANLPVRYGAIGFHLGHEITHGFDNMGSRYDGEGNLANWWSPDIWKRFEERTHCVEEQAGAYEPIDGIRVDAKMTLGENVADLGGLKLAFRAYRNARKSAKEIAVAGGYSEDQQFFLSYAQDHCVKFGPEDLRVFLRTNPHLPHWLRVNGVVRNLPEFSAAFGCARPKSTCEVW